MIERLKSYWETFVSILKFIYGLFFTKEGKKETLNTKRALRATLTAFSLAIALNYVITPEEDTSSVTKSTKKKERKVKQSKRAVFGDGRPLDDSTESEKKSTKKVRKKLKYKAKQVLVNGETKDASKAPLGTSAVAELLTTIDSRDPSQIIRVRLPFGLRSYGEVILPRDSILLGRSSYDQGNDRAYVTFFTSIDDEGREIPISAQALDSKDFSSGLVGEVHSNKGMKIAANVALNVISGAAGFAQSRSMGVNGVAAPDFNLDNALLSGASKATSEEATALGNDLKSDKDYITVDAGRDLIVMLTQQFKQGNL